jgi:2-dehydropantoate 2-reductase
VNNETIFILGAGAIGLALAVHLTRAGQDVHLVRTSLSRVNQNTANVSVNGGEWVQISVSSLADLNSLEGIIVNTAKTYANEGIAKQLKAKRTSAPLVLMQNGIGIEAPFLQAGFSEVYRAVLYASSQKTGSYEAQFRMVKSSPVGVISGSEEQLKSYLERLNTLAFQFHIEANIQEEIWRKGIINAVFNTICTLLATDNGIFARNHNAADLASSVIRECVQVTKALGLQLDHDMLLRQVLTISKSSDGQLISTLQDMQNKRQTEIDSLNFEIVRVAEGLSPSVNVSLTKALGELVKIKSSFYDVG